MSAARPRAEGLHSTTLMPARRTDTRLLLVAKVRLTSYRPAVAAVVAVTVKVTASATATDKPRILRMAVDAAALVTVTSVDVPVIEAEVMLLTVSPALRYSAQDNRTPSVSPALMVCRSRASRLSSSAIGGDSVICCLSRESVIALTAEGVV